MRQRGFIAFLSVGIVAAMAATAACDTDVLEEIIRYTTSTDEIYIAEVDGYSLVKLENSYSAGAPGTPLLPRRRLVLVLPQGAKVCEVLAADAVWLGLDGRHMIYPAQPPRPLSSPHRAFTAPDRDVYLMPGPFPADPIHGIKAGNAGGFRLVGLDIAPIQYLPRDGRLAYLAGADIKIRYTISGPPAEPRSQFQVDEMSRALNTLVANPEDLAAFAPSVAGRMQKGALGSAGAQDLDEYRHIVIAPEGLAGQVEPLSAWRTQQGYPSKVETLEDIVAAYPGWDDAERVRNFIIDANSSWGTLYFTIVGDLGTAPVRYVGDPLAPPSENFPSDLYFSDLDGTWDANGNHIYGEETDSVDYYSDVYVGRASVETAAEAGTFATKTLTYEKTPPAGYIENCLLPGVQLWQNYWGAFVNDSIAAVTPTPPWNDILLYERYGTASRQGVIDAINSGVGYCHYSAHGNANGVYFAGGDTLLHSTDALALTNGGRLGLHNSIACISGAFDGGEVLGDCFAEHLMNHPGGGAVACIMNSRVGLGTPPTMGPSEHLSLEFYRKLFDEAMHRAGMAHGISRDAWVGTGNLAYDFCLAELNLFGDAALSLWTAEPGLQTVEHPLTVPAGPGSFTVTAQSGASPLQGALVCVMTRDLSVYHYGETGAGGDITFVIDPSEGDTLQVTSTAPNHLPYEGSVLVEGGSSGIAGDDGAMEEATLRLSANPVVGSTTFRFGLVEAARVSIKVFDISGRVVQNVVDRRYESGNYQAHWNVDRSSETPVAPGIYFVTFTAGNYSVTRQVVVLR